MKKYNSCDLGFIKKNEGKFGWLKNFDMFGVNFSFRINKQDKFKTKTGGVWFLNFIIFVFILSIFHIKRYFDIPIFYVNSYESQMINENEKDHISMNKENFYFGVKIAKTNKDKNLFNQFSINSSIKANITEDFYLKAFYTIRKNGNISIDQLDELTEYDKKNLYSKKYEQSKNQTIFSLKLNRTTCNFDNFDTSNRLNVVEKLINIEEFDIYCYQIKNHFTIKGNFFDQIFKYFKISIFFNNNNIEKNLKKDIQLEIFYPLNFNDNEDFDNNRKIIDSMYDTINFDYMNNYDFFVKRILFLDDSGIFFKNENRKFSSQLEKWQKRDSLLNIRKNETHSIIANIYFKSSFIYSVIKRSRRKIIDIFQIICTISVNFYILLEIIISAINDRKAKTFIIDNIIEYKNNLFKNNSAELLKIQDSILEKNASVLTKSSPFYKNMNEFFTNKKKMLSSIIDRTSTLSLNSSIIKKTNKKDLNLDFSKNCKKEMNKITRIDDLNYNNKINKNIRNSKSLDKSIDKIREKNDQEENFFEKIFTSDKKNIIINKSKNNFMEFPVENDQKLIEMREIEKKKN